MNSPKFSMNALLAILISCSAIALFFTVGLYDMAGSTFLLTDEHPVEGTDLIIKYSTSEPSGIYKGPKNTQELVAEGQFGYDWGCALSGDTLFVNEYHDAGAGLTMSDLVSIDLNTFEKTVLFEDVMMRGKCASGELVCTADCLPPSDVAATSSLCRLYCMTSSEYDPGSTAGTVLFLDPDTGEVLYSVYDEHVIKGKTFDVKWLSRTLEEVRGE